MSSVPNVIHFNCQSCGMLLTVPEELAGVTGPCPHCGTTITSPTSAPPGPSWPMAQNAATGAATATATATPEDLPQPEPAPASEPSAPVASASVPVSAPLPSPSPSPLPVPAYPAPTYPLAPPAPGLMERPVSTSPHTSPSSTWEASNPPQASPLPPAVGGGVLNRAWPPVSNDLPPGASPSSAPSVMDSVLQMPGVHPAQVGQPGFPQAAPGGPFPRNSPVGTQRSKASQGASSSRKAPTVLALLLTLLALGGAAWFFRDRLNEAWKTFTTTRKVEAAALEFHPSAPIPDKPATSPAASGNQSVPFSAPTPPGAASVGSNDAPAPGTPASADGSPAPSLGSTSEEQIQRPSAMASNAGGTRPPETALTPGTPASDEGTAPRATPPPPAPPAPVPNVGENPSPATPAPQNNDFAPAITPPMRALSASPTPAPVQETLYENVSEEIQPALDALKRFLAAPIWEERLQVVQSAGIIKSRMQSYYAATPYTPLYVGKVNLIRHDKTSPNGPPLCIFEIEGGDLKRPVPVMVEEAVDGWKVDWVTFTEFKDNLLARFMESPKEGSKRFHVLVRRTHYFDDNVPELDKKICMEVQAPMPPYVGSVFARRGTQLANILDRYLGWQVDQAAVVVELEWRREGDQQWVELTNLPQFNWRNATAHEVSPPPAFPLTPPVAVPAE